MAEPRNTETTEPVTTESAEARGAPAPHERADDRHRDGQPRAAPALARVRDDDLEPHDGLRYVARLFKVLALLLIFMLIAEVIIGFQQDGMTALSMLLVEATRLIVFAGFLWGAGDMAILLIESNHDLRASRILLGRLNGKVERLVDGPASEEPGAGEPPARTSPVSRAPRPPR